MSAWLQIYGSNGKISFDSNYHRLLRYVGEFNATWQVDSVVWNNGSYQRVNYKGTLDLGYTYSIDNTIFFINQNNSGMGSSVSYKDNNLIVQCTTPNGNDPSSSFNPVKVVRF